MQFLTLPPPDDRPFDLVLAIPDASGDELAAIAIATHDPASELADLRSIVVAAAHRRRGLASALIAEFELRLRARGAKMIDAAYDPSAENAAIVGRLLEK